MGIWGGWIIGLIASLIAISQVTKVPCSAYKDELHLSTYSETARDGTEYLVAEVWGGGVCSSDDAVWIVGNDGSSRPWFPLGHASDIDSGVYVKEIPLEDFPHEGDFEIHLVIADKAGHQNLLRFLPDKESTVGLDNLPEGTENWGRSRRPFSVPPVAESSPDPTPSPGQTPSSEPAPTEPTPSIPPVDQEAIAVTIQLDEPSVRHGESLGMTITAHGLNGRRLWVVDYPEQGNGAWYRIQNTPALSEDGDGRFTDTVVGDISDAGHTITYQAYAADEGCEAFLASMERFTRALDDHCGIPVAEAVVHVE